MRKITIFFMFLVSLSTCQVFSQDCGKKTNERISSASTVVTLNGGVLKSIKGKVFYPNQTIAENIIVELFSNPLSPLSENVSWDEISKITNQTRLEARYIEDKGEFCFKNIKAGNYLLRINTSSEFSQFSTVYMFVTVNPKEKDKKRKLEIVFELAI